MFENPTPKEGEVQGDFISRCIPYVSKEHPEWAKDKITAVCFSIWRRSKSNGGDYVPESKDVEVKCNAKLVIETNDKGESTYKIVAAVGNMFMDGGFLSNDVLKRSAKQWNGTLHDINHKGVSSKGMDILYFVGYHDNAEFNDETGELTMALHIDDDTKFSRDWKAFVNLCKKAGKMANVSTTYAGKSILIEAKKLPIDYTKFGLQGNDLVPYLENVYPVAVSTVLSGRCDDKAGCGVCNGNDGIGDQACGCESPDNTKPSKEELELQQKKNELIQKIKEMEDK